MAERQPRAATVEKRARLLDVAEQIMLADGYAAVSSRSVAAAAGMNHAALVHYYFPTLDDLFVEVFRRRAERNVERMAEALASEEPLRAWWQIASDPRGTALLLELTAAANHRRALRAEVARLARDMRRMQIDALGRILSEYGVDADEFPPALVAAAVQGLALVVVSDKAQGFDTAPEEAADAVLRLIDRLEAGRTRPTIVDKGRRRS